MRGWLLLLIGEFSLTRFAPKLAINCAWLRYDITFETEKVSIPQLFAEVNDMTNNSERYKMVIVREVDGVKTINRLDMTQASILNSPYYYLAQNDVIYIEPTRNKIDAGAIPSVLKNASIILGTAVSILLIPNFTK